MVTFAKILGLIAVCIIGLALRHAAKGLWR
jgi:hypothetical protein